MDDGRRAIALAQLIKILTAAKALYSISTVVVVVVVVVVAVVIVQRHI